MALGFDAVCTGHYARLIRNGDDVELHRAADAGKDQSYVLGVLNQDQLRRSYFPLGGSLKSDVRAEAPNRGLSVAEKPDSHDICFIADGDTAGFLDRRLGARPGDIVDATGARVGEHAGSHQFTIGQRRGLRLGHPGRRRSAPLRTGHLPGDQHRHRRPARCARSTSRSPPSARPGPATARHPVVAAKVQLRAHGEPLPATVRVRDDELEVMLDAAAAGVAPGQAAVLYDGTRVVGSATISATS